MNTLKSRFRTRAPVLAKAAALALVAGVLPAPAAVAQQVWRVDADAIGGANNGLTWADAFVDLQSALAVAVGGDEVWVAEGVYTPSPSNVDLSFDITRGVALYGGFSGTETSRGQRDWQAHETRLSGDVGQDDVVGSGRYWYANWNINSPNSKHVVTIVDGNASTTVDGFTIDGGYATMNSGGGVYVEGGNPVIANCRLEHNSSAWGYGGAVFLLDSDARISQCEVVENSNHLTNGAGVATYGTSGPTIADSFFQYNRVTADSNDGTGGAISHWGSGELTVERCTFDTNLAHPFYSVGPGTAYGGAIFNFTAALMVADCNFFGNEATLGGGVWSFGPAAILNCRFAENKAIPQPQDPYPEIGGFAAGVGATSFPGAEIIVTNCTIVNNDGKKFVGLYTDGSANAVVTNSIIFHNNATDPEVVGYWPSQLKGTFDLAYSCVYRIFDPPAPGEDPIEPDKLPGVIDGDPSFVNLVNSTDLHLAAGSPCIDAGDNRVLPPSLKLDLGGAQRYMDDPATPDTGWGVAPVIDMGCYEFPGEGGGTGGTLVVSPAPLIAGQTGRFSVTEATPHGAIYLAYSTKGLGSTFVAPLNVTLDLRQPAQAGNRLVTNGNGAAEWRLPVPGGAAGMDVWFQAAQFESKTNVVATSVAP